NESSERFRRMMEEEHSFETLAKEILIMKLEFMEKFSIHFIRDLYEGEMPELQESLLKMQDSGLTNAQMLFDLGKSQEMIDSAVNFDYFLFLLDQLQQTYTSDRVIAIYPDPKERLQVTFTQFFFGIMGRKQK